MATATKTSLKKWIRAAWNFIALIPSRSIRQMLAKFLDLSSKGMYQSSGKEKESCCFVFPSSTKRDARAKLLFWQYKPSAFLPFSLTSWSSLLKLPKDHDTGNYVLCSPGRGTWVNFWWVSAAGLSEPLLHYSPFLWPIIDAILVTFGQIRNFRDPNLVTF